WFVRAEGKVQLVPVHGTDSDWYRNVEAAPKVRLGAAGREVEATATPVDDARRVSSIVDAFKAKYGTETFERLYPKPDAAVEVSIPTIIVPLDARSVRSGASRGCWVV